MPYSEHVGKLPLAFIFAWFSESDLRPELLKKITSETEEKGEVRLGSVKEKAGTVLVDGNKTNRNISCNSLCRQLWSSDSI